MLCLQTIFGIDKHLALFLSLSRDAIHQQRPVVRTMAHAFTYVYIKTFTISIVPIDVLSFNSFFVHTAYSSNNSFVLQPNVHLFKQTTSQPLFSQSQQL